MFLPTITLNADIRAALQANTLKLNRGQWIEWNGAKGRFISNTRGVLNILWKFKGEAFKHFTLRFKRACMTTGKRNGLRPAQFPHTGTAAPSPNFQQQDAFLQDIIDLPQWVDGDTLDEMRDNPEAFESVTICGNVVEPYQLLMKSRTGQLLKSLVTGKKRIVDNDHAHQYAVWGRSHYAHYPQGWEGVCLH